MSTQILSPVTAGIHPEQFSDDLVLTSRRTLAVIVLIIFLLIGFALRISDLGAESLGEDELNKLQTAQEYRTNGLSGKNGEHPFLMKGMQTVSLAAFEKLNAVLASQQLNISEEAALRFPVALLGTFTILLLFLLESELFGPGIALISAALWAVEPMAIGFDRIAKEDSLVLFFFLLANLCFVKSQTAAQRGNANWHRYLWGAAAAFAALMASKYYPHLLAVMAAYYNTFIILPGNKWHIGKAGWLKFFIIMGVAFLTLNPTIVLPDTWREMLKFSSEGRIGHDSYEYIGRLYPHKMTAWLAGVPWTFYYVFIAVKTSLPTVILFLIGLPMMFRRRLGDGRFLIFFWAFMWFMPFSVLGGKFTRYFTLAEPLILITAAAGFYFSLRWVASRLAGTPVLSAVCQVTLFAAFIAVSLVNSFSVTPHFRLFTNTIGGGTAAAGDYFPHDEFYDTSTRDIVAAIASAARPQAVVACETPSLFEYYSAKYRRTDLSFVSLSDQSKIASLVAGDFIVIARGRRYVSNTSYEDYLTNSATPLAEIKIMGVTSARIYTLHEMSLAGIRSIADQ